VTESASLPLPRITAVNDLNDKDVYLTDAAIKTTTVDGKLMYRVCPTWAGVDRPGDSGVVCRTTSLAHRLRRAFLAGKALKPETAVVKMDVMNRTYVSVDWTVRARVLNADLRELGY
jgi:hypothetical protein